jgi:poly(hydroxyalkanoate) depolymerase family esterase
MKSLFFIIIINVFQVSAQLTEIGVSEFGKNPGNLGCFVQPSVGSNRPLIIVLHGCTQSAQEAISVSGWDKLAQENDFFLLAPQQRILNNSNRCFNWFLSQDIDTLNGEAASMFNMLAYCLKRYSVDSSQVFVTGFSAGGQMGVTLLALRPDLFKGGAVFACGPFGLAEKPSQALKAMHGKPELSQTQLVKRITDLHSNQHHTFPSLFIYHGDDDPVVYPICATQLFTQWKGINLLNEQNEKTVELKNHSFIRRTTVANSDQSIRVVRYQFAGLGHQIPVDPGIGIGQGGQYNLFSKDQNFWSALQVAIDFGLVLYEGR